MNSLASKGGSPIINDPRREPPAAAERARRWMDAYRPTRLSGERVQISDAIAVIGVERSADQIPFLEFDRAKVSFVSAKRRPGLKIGGPFRVEGGPLPSEQRSSQKGGFQPFLDRRL